MATAFTNYATPAPIDPIDKRQEALDKLTAALLSEFAPSSSGGGAGGGGVPAGKARTLTNSTVSSGGSVAAGAIGVQFILSSDFAGTIGGQTFAGATSAFWSPPPLLNPNDTYPSIPYTISAGSAILNVLT